MSKTTPRKRNKVIFVTVKDGVAEVDPFTVPEGVHVEIVDIDALETDGDCAARLSPEAQAYAKDNGYL